MKCIVRLALGLATVTFIVVAIVLLTREDYRPATALAYLQELRVEPEQRCSPYRRSDYPYNASKVEPRIVMQMGGQVYGPYTGTTFPTTASTDVEHIIALSEAHDSGLCDASGRVRRRFARDLDNLTLASPSVNQHQKSDKDAAEWLPPFIANRCWFAGRVIAVRREYRLSVDSLEWAALAEVLAKCETTRMVR